MHCYNPEGIGGGNTVGEQGWVVNLFHKGGSQILYEILWMSSRFFGLLCGEMSEDQLYEGQKYISIA